MRFGDIFVEEDKYLDQIFYNIMDCKHKLMI